MTSLWSHSLLTLFVLPLLPVLASRSASSASQLRGRASAASAARGAWVLPPCPGAPTLPPFTTTPAPVPPALPGPPPSAPLKPLRVLPELTKEMLPTLGPLPTGPPVPPPVPPPKAAPPPYYEAGNVYAAKDGNGTWQLVHITSVPVETVVNGTSQLVMEGDVLVNVSTRPGVPPVVAAHWPVVHGAEEFLRTTPPPPTAAPLRQYVKGVVDGHWVLPNGSNRNGTIGTNATLAANPVDFHVPGYVPETFKIEAGTWPLAWRRIGNL